MARRSILEYPDPRLRQRSAPVEQFDDDLSCLIDDLIETLHATGGIGLAAPQVDDRRRVLVMDHSGNATAPDVLVNPVIVADATPGLVEESCLSLPGLEGNVIRATEVRVQAQDRHGATFQRDLSGMEAVCLQHEIDHLDGRLFLDRLPLLQRLRIRMAGLSRGRRIQRGRDAA